MGGGNSVIREEWFADLREKAERMLDGLEGEASFAASREVDRLLHEVRVAQVELEMQNDELRRAYEELQNTLDRYSDLYDFAPVAYFTMDPRGLIQEANLAGAALLGIGKRALVGTNLAHFVAPEDRDAYWCHRRRVMDSMARQTFDLKMVRPDGIPFYARLECIALRLGTGDLTGIRAVISDITDRRQAEEALFHEKERAETTLRSIGDGVITTSSGGTVEFLNATAETLTGWANAEAFGKPLQEIFRVVDERTREPIEDPIKRCLRSGRIAGLANHSLLVSRTGQEFEVQDSAAPIRDRGGAIVGAVLVFQDVTESRRIAREIAHQANHDPLTGLVNRREFERRVDNSLISTRVRDAQHALCFIDLDRFKTVNDTAGHAAGDEVLRQVAGLLMRQVRGRDTLARLGGDEFCLLIENCPLDKAHAIAEGLVEAIRHGEFFWGGRAFEIGATIGVVPVDKDSESTRHLLTDADVACYTAKDLGRNRVQIHPNYAGSLSDSRHSIISLAELQKALAADRFQLFYQPIQPLNETTRGLGQHEVLLRLLNGNEELVRPDAFIPTAERYGVMPAIDRWVIRHALRRIGSRMVDPRHPGIAINLSGSSLSDVTLLDFILEQVQTAAFPTDRLCFEVTETAAIRNLTQAGQFIARLRERGCRFALDDFGRGLSSLTYLKHLPVDYLKIDGSFIRDIADSSSDRAMIAAVNQLAHAMDIETIAEGVESASVIETLRSLGVNYVQGYAIGEPMPLVA